MNRLFIWAAVCLLTPPVEGGLIGFWNFSETGGSIAHDSSGSGTNGSLTANGAAFNPGAGPNGGGAINLSTGFVDMGNNFAFSGTQAFSIQAWIRTTATGSGTVMTRHYSNNQDGYILGINNFDSFCLNSSYNNKAAVLAGDGGNGCNLNGPAISVTPPSMVVVNDGAWHQLLVAFSGGTESLYVDGAFQGSATGVNISSCPTVDFIVGGYNVGGSGPCGIGTPTNGFTGLISDVAVWNEALTPAQVLTAFRNPGNPGLTEAIQPTILSGGIVPVYSSSTTIQPGEWVSIYGSNLSSATAIWTGNFPTSLGGTSVTINGKSAYLWVVSPGQINLQAPIDTATGPVPVVVTTGNGSVTSTVTLAQFAPSFLLLDSRHVTAIILRSDGSGAYGGGHLRHRRPHRNVTWLSDGCGKGG